METYARGERQAIRTRTALTEAFAGLMGEKRYGEISVRDIVLRGNTGRSTFYRYFRSKADLLVSLHENRFDRLLASLSSKEGWLSEEPPREFVAFLKIFEEMGGTDVSLVHMLGSDLDYVLHHINRLLSKKLEAALSNVFGDETPAVPLELLARSVAGSWCWVVFSWLKRDLRQSPEEVAGAVHRLSRASVRDAFRL